MRTISPRAAALLSTLALTGTALTPVASTAAATAFAPNHRVANSTSTNWSGYAATATRFTSISATWTQPTATCGSTTTYSSFWVGLDGDTSNTVEQTGSEADCSSGSPVYTSWYEMYPKFPVYYSNPVRPGDVFHGSVTTNGSGSFTLTQGVPGLRRSHRRSAVQQRRRPAAHRLRHRRVLLDAGQRPTHRKLQP